MAAAWVYMLRCADGAHVVDHAPDLEQALAAHRAGRAAATRQRLPVELVFFRMLPDAAMAELVARQIAGWPRAQQDALVAEHAATIRRP